MPGSAETQVPPTLVPTKKGGATRKMLLDSTITLLASTGYAATTTQAVLDHSGLSRGSLLHQFKTRDVLMVATAMEAVDRMFAEVGEKLSGIADPVEKLRQLPRVQWAVQNQIPARAYAELQLASRWHKDLQAALRPAIKLVNERTVREVRHIAEANGLQQVGELVLEVGALISAMQGLAASATLMEDNQMIEDLLDVFISHYNHCLQRCMAK